jgi:hypothetical protein
MMRVKYLNLIEFFSFAGFAALILLLISCISIFSGKKEEQVVRTEMLNFQRGACFGRCPVFRFTVYSDGYAVYQGIRFVQKIGFHERFLTKGELSGLKDACEKAKLWGFEDSYERKIADLPTVRFAYHKGDVVKRISGNLKMPDTLEEIFSICDNLTEKGKWIKLEEAPEFNEPDKMVIEEEIIVQLKETIDFQTWKKKYAPYRLMELRRIAPRLNYWVVTFDKRLMVPEKMIKLIKEDRDVVDAEFNKRLSPRGN